MKNTNKGFTLVELSIVLVIIGLLIGGILVGQSMIESVRMTKIGKDVGNYIVLIEQFKSKFKCIPGDCNKGFIPTAISGNGNGVVPKNEGAVVLAQIKLLGLYQSSDDFVECTKNWSTAGQATKECFLPGSYKDSIMWIDAVTSCPNANWCLGDTMQFNNAATEIGDQFIVYAGNNNLGDGNSATKPWVLFDLFTAKYVDAKFDDGLPNSGKVLGRHAGGATNCVEWNTHGATDPYWTTNNGSEVRCVLGFNIGRGGLFSEQFK